MDKERGLISVQGLQGKGLPAALARQAEKGAGAAQIARVVASTWQKIDTALSPVIGKGGVAALYKRSFYLTAASYPWLASAHEGAQNAMNLTALESMLALQSGANAAAGGGSALQTFYELLTSLIGGSLTERLLRSAWADLPIDGSEEETSP